MPILMQDPYGLSYPPERFYKYSAVSQGKEKDIVMQNWYNIAQVFLINYPEVWMALLVAFAAALSMRSDVFPTMIRYGVGIAALIGASYWAKDVFNL